MTVVSVLNIIILHFLGVPYDSTTTLTRANVAECCWAMAVVASVEAAHYQNTLQLISLSVQELIDCDTESSGCERGYKEHAFGYIQDNGLLSESSYPYMARGSKSGCHHYKTQEAATRISGFQFVDPT
jgi:hypothetical protein